MRRVMMDCVSFSYSTDVLRGTAERCCIPAAQASLGFMRLAFEVLVVVLKVFCALELLALESYAGMVMPAARWKALAMLTEVSLTLHLLGLGGVLTTRGPTTTRAPPAAGCCCC